MATKEPKTTPDVEKKEAITEEAILKMVEDKAKAILEEAEKKAQQILEEAEKKAKSNDQEKKETTEEDLRMEEYVTVKLFKDSGKYADDVFVAVNGEGCNIPRGIPVQIKRKFAEVLEKSDLQDAKTAQFMEAKSAEFEKESKLRNI